MKPLNFKGAVPFNKPVDWNDERDGECHALPVLVDGPYRISLWTFDDRERAAIAAGWQLHLCCMGSQPPVSLWLINPKAAEAINESSEKTSWWGDVKAALQRWLVI